MKISKAKQVLEMLIPENGIQYKTPFLRGWPGIGKSYIVREIAKNRKIKIIDIRLSQHDSTDIKGIPRVNEETRTVFWNCMEDLPLEGNVRFDKDSKGILFLDELNRANPQTLQSIFELVQDRRVGGRNLLKNWFIVAAGNVGYEDNTDVTEFDTALKDRFVFIDIDKENFEDWIDWASKNNIDKNIFNFINKFPQYLYTGDETLDERKHLNETIITPRRWEDFSNIIKANSDKEYSLVVNTVGPSILGKTFINFTSFLNELTKIDAYSLLFKYDDNKVTISSLNRDGIYELNRNLVAFIHNHLDNKIRNEEDSELVFKNFHKYITEDVKHEDHVISIFKDIVGTKSAINDKGVAFANKYVSKFPDQKDKIGRIIVEAMTGIKL